jgi:hypothetical protein
VYKAVEAVEVNGVTPLVDACGNEVGFGEEVYPGLDQARVLLVHAFYGKGKVGLPGVAYVEITALAVGRYILDKFQVVGRQPPWLSGYYKLGNAEVGIRVTDQPARVLVALLLTMDTLEPEYTRIEVHRSVEVRNGKTKMPHT